MSLNRVFAVVSMYWRTDNDQRVYRARRGVIVEQRWTGRGV